MADSELSTGERAPARRDRRLPIVVAVLVVGGVVGGLALLLDDGDLPDFGVLPVTSERIEATLGATAQPFASDRACDVYVVPLDSASEAVATRLARALPRRAPGPGLRDLVVPTRSRGLRSPTRAARLRSSSPTSSPEPSRTPEGSRLRRSSASPRSTSTRRHSPRTSSTSESRKVSAEAGFRGRLHCADGVGRGSVQAAGDDGDALRRPPLLRPAGEPEHAHPRSARRPAASRSSICSSRSSRIHRLRTPSSTPRGRRFSRRSERAQRPPPGRRRFGALRVAQGDRALPRRTARGARLAAPARGL